MSLTGRLGLYTLPSPAGVEAPQRPYFTSGDLASSRALVFIGGLYNGIGSVPYVAPLSESLEKQGWRVVQFVWTSNYSGFGTGSLDRDVAEMSAVIKQIRTEGVETVVIMGHSTGSQDVIHYLTSPGYVDREPVSGGIMQAPASDRQFFTKDDSKEAQVWKDALIEAESLIDAGKKHHIMNDDFCDAVGCRMTAYRLHSLVGVGGDDDYFSSDIPDSATTTTVHVHPLDTSFGSLPAPALVLWSGKDEYGYLKDQAPLLNRWETAAKGKLRTVIIPDADHAEDVVVDMMHSCSIASSYELLSKAGTPQMVR